MDEQQDDLVDCKAEEKGKPGGDQYMPNVLPVVVPPPLPGDRQNKKRDTERRAPDHQKIDGGARSSQTVDGTRRCGVYVV